VNECLVCQEVSGAISLPGGPLQSGDLSLVFHIPPLDKSDVYLGHLLVVPRRHVADFAGLEERESSEIGISIGRWSRALTRAGAERVYVATIGHSFDHLHVHLLPRWPGTPPSVSWHSVDEWPGARRGDFAAAADFADRLDVGPAQ
jgi:diadenosine tetraphosphate (Ap4A) HIT family hydrolase